MTDWLPRLLNLPPEYAGHYDQGRLLFLHPNWLWALLAIPPLAWFMYRRQQLNLPTVPGWVRFLLTATRVLILTMLVLVLAGPYLDLHLKIEKQPIVALLFDHSHTI